MRAVLLLALGAAVTIFVASTSAATRGRRGTSCVGRDGRIDVIRTEPGGDELGLVSEGRFARLYKAPHDRGQSDSGRRSSAALRRPRG